MVTKHEPDFLSIDQLREVCGFPLFSRLDVAFSGRSLTWVGKALRVYRSAQRSLGLWLNDHVIYRSKMGSSLR